MSILIKGMEMPTRCGRCDMCVHESDGDIDYHNACCITGADILDVGEKMEDCPLIAVPEHGDLIDRDALRKSDRLVGKMMMFGGEYVYTQTEIDRAPVIIPADKEGE